MRLTELVSYKKKLFSTFLARKICPVSCLMLTLLVTPVKADSSSKMHGTKYIFFPIEGCSSPKEKNVNSESGNDERKNKRKAQQSPITNYFKERKTLQVKEAVKVKPANTNRGKLSQEVN